jgi:hypothetical protein
MVPAAQGGGPREDRLRQESHWQTRPATFLPIRISFLLQFVVAAARPADELNLGGPEIGSIQAVVR